MRPAIDLNPRVTNDREALGQMFDRIVALDESSRDTLRRRGAKGNGTTDDASAVQTAFRNNRITTIDGEGLTYNIGSATTFNDRTAWLIVRNATFSYSASGGVMFTSNGSIGSAVTPSNISAGDSTATFTSTSGHAKRDWHLFRSANVWGNGGTTHGEWNMVRSVDSATVNTYERQFHLDYDSTPEVYTPTLQPGIAFINCHFIGGGDADDEDALTVTFTENFIVQNCTFKDFARRCASSTSNVYCHHSGNRYLNGDDATGLAYGSMITREHEAAHVSDCHGQGLRHVVTCGGSTGITWNIGISNITGSACTESVVDCHEGTAHVTISNVEATFANTQSSSEGDGLTIQGAYNTISNVNLKGSERHGLLAQLNTAAPNDFLSVRNLNATDWGTNTTGSNSLVNLSFRKDNSAVMDFVHIQASGSSSSSNSRGVTVTSHSEHSGGAIDMLNIELDVECASRCVSWDAGSASYTINKARFGGGPWETTGSTEAFFISGNANVNFTHVLVDPAMIIGGTHAVENDQSTVITYVYKRASGQTTGLVDGEIELHGMPTFTVAGVPDVSANEGRMIYVSDETGGAVPAFSAGTDWRRATDLARVS